MQLQLVRGSVGELSNEFKNQFSYLLNAFTKKKNPSSSSSSSTFVFVFNNICSQQRFVQLVGSYIAHSSQHSRMTDLQEKTYFFIFYRLLAVTLLITLQYISNTA